MKCINCGSEAVVRFTDGFGEQRLYCRACNSSYKNVEGQHDIRRYTKRLRAKE